MKGITNAPVLRILLLCGNCSSKNLEKKGTWGQCSLCHTAVGKQSCAEVALQVTLPGVAGRAGAEDGVSDGDGYEVVMKTTVHPTFRHHVRTVGDCATWARKK